MCDAGNQRIRYIDFAAGTVTTVAGGGTAGPDDFYVPGDYADGDALEARFDFPRGLALMPDGGLLIADSGNHAVRLLKNGKVYTVVGNDRAEPGRADGTEKSARLSFPTDVDVDAQGTIYVADAHNNQIRVITGYRLPAGAAKDGMVRMDLGGRLVAFDAPPVIRNDRVFVPVRSVAEAPGYAVEATDSRQVILAREGVRATLRIGQARATVDKGAGAAGVTLDAAAFIEGIRAFVPVRFVAEAPGAQVDWLADWKLVVIR